ncbi:MAG TPA: hypothetical protein VF788_16645 [Pseudonocardiaceae bacterium]
MSSRSLWDSDQPPFPGSEAFTEQDSVVFFGRDAEITELPDRLQPPLVEQANRLVAVVDPWGVGKSSLVHAGVVPRLRLRRSGWIVVPTVVSGDHPLHRFAHSVAAACPGSTVNGLPASSFAEGLRVPTRNLNAPVLVIVDQVEELITLSGHTFWATGTSECS